jgi:sterol desaturase/sphingolipid hydroxylase (fatty acid hydroxylase superfamily)
MFVLTIVQTPASIRWAEEARKSRRRLYPVTVVYTLVAVGAMTVALRSSPGHAAAAWLLGVAFWTFVEYIVHRFVLHGVFPDGPGLRHALHLLFDHLHVEHHERPWDGNHINGTIKDTGPFLLPAFLLALALPPHTLLAFLCGLAQAYVAEEWVHHSVHFRHFDNPYFRYIRRHHLYHHSQRGREVAFGLTSGAWDAVLDTRIPDDVRAAFRGPAARRSAGRRTHFDATGLDPDRLRG